MPFPQDTPSYNAYILDAVRKGNYDVEWLPVTSVGGGHTARFNVMADALKIEGVRVTVSAFLEQQIADLLGASLLTPKIADLLFVEADIAIPPITRDVSTPARMAMMSSTEWMIEQSQNIDKAIISAVGSLAAAKGRIVQTVGKHWCIGNSLDLPVHAGAALNYGWHWRQNSGEVCASLIKNPTNGQFLRMIQGQGWRHDPSHRDYSQNCVLVQQNCLLDEVQTTLDALLVLPDFASLASHEGVMTVLRQPGVPVASV